MTRYNWAEIGKAMASYGCDSNSSEEEHITSMTPDRKILCATLAVLEQSAESYLLVDDHLVAIYRVLNAISKTLDILAAPAERAEADRKREDLKKAAGEHANTRISALRLCARAANALRDEGVDTVGELIGMTAFDILSLRSVVVHTLRDVHAKLANIGLALKDDKPTTQGESK